MPRSTTPTPTKSNTAVAATIARLEEKLTLLDAKFQKLQSQVATFKRQAMQRRDTQTERQLRAKLGRL